MNCFEFLIGLCMFLLSPSCLGATLHPKNIFILGGQSNMAGRGGVFRNNVTDLLEWNRFIPPESKPNPSILRFNAKNRWELGHEPLHRDIDWNKTNGISPGISFGNVLLAKAGSRAGIIGLVPCARGGTHITNWTKTDKPKTTRYYELLHRIKASEKYGGKVRALFWFQGESDAAHKHTAAAYYGRLKQFLIDLRNDLKPRVLPVILVKIASYDRFVPKSNNNMKTVREAQEAVSRELPAVKVVDAMRFVRKNGTGFNWDRGHLNIRSEVRLGETLANAYLASFGKYL